MYKNPKVSVIVVNYNGALYIRKCLESLMNQDYHSYEIIFVDNNSEDRSVELVNQEFSEVRVIANQRNLGYTGGISSGLAYSQGQYLAPLNVDTEVEKDWLGHMAKFMDANPDVGAVTPKSLLYNNRNIIGTQGLNIHITGLGFVRGLKKPDTNLPSEPFQVAAISGCSFIVRREIIDRMGGFNEANFMYYDDVDLSWMVNLMGYKIYCIPQSRIYHEYELKMTPQKMYWLEYGRLSSLLCYLRPFTFIVLLPALLLTEIQIAGYCVVHGPRYIWAKIRAIIAVLTNIESIIKRRRRVQSLRKNSDFQILRRFEINYEWGQLLNILK